MTLAAVGHGDPSRGSPGTGFGVRGYTGLIRNRKRTWRFTIYGFVSGPARSAIALRRLADCAVPEGLPLGRGRVLLLGLTAWPSGAIPGWVSWGHGSFAIPVPTVELFPPIAGEMVAERRMYLPLAAVVTIVVIGAYALGKRLLHKRPGIPSDAWRRCQ